jgi:hypothetical protein
MTTDARDPVHEEGWGMGLVRIGRVAVDPATIARIEDHGRGQAASSVKVVFRDGAEVLFHEPDAKAFRAFVAALPDGVALAPSLGAPGSAPDAASGPRSAPSG